MGLMQSKNSITLRIRTGDQKGAATDANVYVILYDTSDNSSEKILVDNFWKNDFKIGALDTFDIQLPESFTEVKKIELWTEKPTVELTSSTWFIQTLELVRGFTRKSVTFPVFRWIRPSVHYSLYPWDTFLPQNDPDKEQRENEIKCKREIYKLKHQKGCPIMLESLPVDEEFSDSYKKLLFISKMEVKLKNWISGITTDSWQKLDDLTNIYYKEGITKPKVGSKSSCISSVARQLMAAQSCVCNESYQKILDSFTENDFQARFQKRQERWNRCVAVQGDYFEGDDDKTYACAYWNHDTWFGYQRLNGCNPKSIKLCEEIPSKLGVDEEMIKPILDGETLEELIQEKRLFYADLEILEGIGHKRGFDVCVPIALFMLDFEDNLVPIAIQLQQRKGSNNPVFLPTDNAGVWTLAKMWFNMADSTCHQISAHLGLTHLLMQVVVLALHRNVSVSHPVYKILAPHTLFLLAINFNAFQSLVSAGSLTEKIMSIRTEDMFKLINKSLQRWDFLSDGIPTKEFQSRKVDDPKVLPKYYFRDDSLALYNCVYKYVSSYIDIYYANEDDVTNDWEIQNWIESMAVGHENGGLQGLPMKDGKGHVSSKEELKDILAVTIFTCSVTHAAVNFLQYEEYGFPANYPSMLRTSLLKDKEPKTEKDVIAALPNKATTFDVLTLTHVFSQKGTNSLGNFETQYIYDPKAVGCVKVFQSDLKRIGDEIRKRNRTLDSPYDVLHPANIPNSISI